MIGLTEETFYTMNLKDKIKHCFYSIFVYNVRYFINI